MIQRLSNHGIDQQAILACSQPQSGVRKSTHGLGCVRSSVKQESEYRLPEVGLFMFGNRFVIESECGDKSTARADSGNSRVIGRRAFAVITNSLSSDPLTLDLSEAAIHKQFSSCDVAGIVRGEKYNGLSDLAGCAEPAERNIGRDHF